MENQRALRQSSKAVLFTSDHRIVLLRRALHDPHSPQEMDIPGGGLEPHEDARAGCVREVYEETGLQIDANKLHLLWFNLKHSSQGPHLNLRYYFTYLLPDANPALKLDPHEHSDGASYEPLLATRLLEHAVHKEALQRAIVAFPSH